MYFLCYQQRQKSKKTQKKTFQKFFVLKILSLPMYKLYLNKYVPAAGLRPLFFSKPQKSIACKQYIGLLSKPVQISTSTTAALQQHSTQRMIIIGLLCYVPCFNFDKEEQQHSTAIHRRYTLTKHLLDEGSKSF